MTTAKAEQAPVGVLAALDSQTPGSFYWYLALLACVGGFLFGYDTSNIGSALPFIPYQLSDFAVGYLVAGASIGAAAGALVAGPLTDRFGRKFLLIIDVAIYAVGAIVSAVALNADMLLSARTLIGVAIGADFVIATAYIAEFAPEEPARLAEPNPAMDDHRGNSRLLHRRPGDPQARARFGHWPGLEADAGSGRGPRDRRPRIAGSHAGIPECGCCSMAARPRPEGRWGIWGSPFLRSRCRRRRTCSP